MKRQGVRGRIALLTCLLSCGLLLPGQAQPPAPSPEQPALKTPAVQATPAAPAQGAPAPQAPVAPQATPSSSVTPAPTAATPTLHLPTEAEREAAAEWKRKGVVGQSTFVDKLRTVTWTLALICFLVWLVGKIASKTTLEKLGLPVEPDSLIEVLEKKRISPGRSVMLLRVGPKVIAVAVTESGFRTLTELDTEALRQFQDERPEAAGEAPAGPETVTGNAPADIAKHYLSIIPGLGAKK